MKNKALVFLCLLVNISFAQDTIIKKNNDMIQAKIIEISSTQIKYKKFNFQDGPTYIEAKSDIASIKFSNGIKEIFNNPVIHTEPAATNSTATAAGDYYDPNAGRVVSRVKMEPYGARYKYNGRKIGEREMQEVLLKTNDKEIIQKIQSAREAKHLQYIGFAAFPLGIASFATLLGGTNQYGQVNDGALTGSFLLLGAAIACPVLSGVFKHKRTVGNKKAVELYNERY
ncbi:MAG: hypothetical protein K0Q95_491 [Bacteroidota bacterium]|jgi:hypothetical protein|nr:hypothetical protein [Bacteroidota bacterium]